MELYIFIRMEQLHTVEHVAESETARNTTTHRSVKDETARNTTTHRSVKEEKSKQPLKTFLRAKKKK